MIIIWILCIWYNLCVLGVFGVTVTVCVSVSVWCMCVSMCEHVCAYACVSYRRSWLVNRHSVLFHGQFIVNCYMHPLHVLTIIVY